MNKMQEKFEKWVINGCSQEDLDFGNIPQYSWLGKIQPRAYHGGFTAGYKSANLLPTEKVCPECGGSGFDSDEDFKDDMSKCPKCKNGIIQIYYTPEEYKTITGEDYPDDVLVWVLYHDDGLVQPDTYRLYRTLLPHFIVYIVQTAQPAPRADYGSKK